MPNNDLVLPAERRRAALFAVFFGTFLARPVVILAHRNRIRDLANAEQGDDQSPGEVDPAERGDQVEEETQAVD